MDILDPFASPATDPDAMLALDPYPGEKVGRRAKLAVTWEGKAIAREIAPHLLSLVYIDNLSGEADTLALNVQDRDSLWSGDWRPEFGDKVVARLKLTEGWFGERPVTDLRLGTFAHDKIGLQGPPRTASIENLSAPMATGLRRRKRTRVWKDVSLKQIGKDIADRAKLSLKWQGDEGFKYKQAYQNDKSDLDFLHEECKQVGRTLKITEDSITIFIEERLDAQPAAGDIDLIGGRVIGWNFADAESARYGSCHVSFFDPRTGKTIKGEFPPKGVTIPGLDPNGQTLEVQMAVSDGAEAAARAKGMLRHENRFANRGALTVVGDCGLVAGVTFNFVNASGLSGKYIITRAEHKVGGGYTVALNVRRCLEGY